MEIIEKIKEKTTLKEMSKLVGIPYNVFLQKSCGARKFKANEIILIEDQLSKIPCTKEDLRFSTNMQCYEIVDNMLKKYSVIDLAKKIDMKYVTLCNKNNGYCDYTESDLEKLTKVYENE